MVRPCALLAAHRALQLLKVLGCKLHFNGGAQDRVPQQSRDCLHSLALMPTSSLRLATSEEIISSDHAQMTGIHCLINISGTRGGAYGNTYVLSRAQLLQNRRPLGGAPNHPWMPNRLGCLDDLKLVLVAGPSANAVS